MKTFKRIVWSMAFAAAFTIVAVGCASMMSGLSQKVTIDSDPQGATVIVGKKKTKDGQIIMVDSRNVGVTPLSFELPRRGSTMVQISKEGYETLEIQLTRKMNNWVWGDIALTSPLSTSIDTTTGAYYEYKPGEFMVTLQAAK